MILPASALAPAERAHAHDHAAPVLLWATHAAVPRVETLLGRRGHLLRSVRFHHRRRPQCHQGALLPLPRSFPLTLIFDFGKMGVFAEVRLFELLCLAAGARDASLVIPDLTPSFPAAPPPRPQIRPVFEPTVVRLPGSGKRLRPASAASHVEQDQQVIENNVSKSLVRVDAMEIVRVPLFSPHPCPLFFPCRSSLQWGRSRRTISV